LTWSQLNEIVYEFSFSRDFPENVPRSKVRRWVEDTELGTTCRVALPEVVYSLDWCFIREGGVKGLSGRYNRRLIKIIQAAFLSTDRGFL
jgi:hypothetical protein